MRIISGIHRGRRLRAPTGEAVRPTPDRVRESVFNILGQMMDGLAFLDLYAGTGAMGLEAASRGAAPVVLVERDPDACDAIRANISHLGCEDAVTLLCAEVGECLGELVGAGTGFDVVFADPPYSEPADAMEALLGELSRGALLAQEGCVVLQQRRGRPVASHPAFEVRRPRHYGITSILIYDRLT